MLKVLFAASECVPFIKTGGLADVVGALPPVLKAQGIDVRVILPLYSEIPEEFKSRMKTVATFEAELGWRKQYCGIETLEYQGITYYFVDNRYYFDRPYVYGMGGDEYERFAFFCRSVLDALPRVEFQPDILHCHDWQAGMIPALHKIQYQYLPFYSNMKSMMTIHNLQYQGVFDRRAVQDCLGLGDGLFTSDKLEFYGAANFLKSGLVYCDWITTVSPSYAKEITTAYYGERLDGLLRARHNELTGVLNGIDMNAYDPAKDDAIAAHYGAARPAGKAKCKLALQREMGLHEDLAVPSRRHGDAPFRPEGARPRRLRAAGNHGNRLSAGYPRQGRQALCRSVQLGAGELARPRSGPIRNEYAAVPSHLRGRGYVPDAVAVRAVRPFAADRPALRDAAHRARNRRPARYGAFLQRIHRRGQRILVLQL